MRNRLAEFTAAAACVAGLVTTTVQTADAVGFTWAAGDGSWQVPQFWAPYSPPALVGPPDFADAATISGNRDVELDADVLGLAGLLLSGAADLFTNGNQLTVVDLNGTAVTTVMGIGITGQNTELFVEPVTGQFAQPSVIADNLNLVNGGELDLESGFAVTEITNVFDVDELSIISGWGVIRFTDAFNKSGPRFNLRGTIRPDPQHVINLNAESGSIDLDGSDAAHSLVDLTNQNSTLHIVGSLSDAYNGRIRMGNGASFAMVNAWTLGRSGATSQPAAALLFDPGAGRTAFVVGGTMTINGSGGVAGNSSIRVDSGTGVIAADAIIQSTAEIQVAAGATLDFDGNVTYTGGASITGAGVFDVGSFNSVIGDVTIATDTVDFDNGDWNITQSLTLDTQTVDGVGGDVFNSRTIDIHSQAIGNDGRLTVHVAPGHAWVLGNDATINITAPGGDLAATNLDGSQLHVRGTVNIDGNSRFAASIRMNEEGVVHLADANSSLSVLAFVGMDGGTISGDGDVRSSSAKLQGDGTITADVNFSGTSVLQAANGTLRITGNIVDLGAELGTFNDSSILQIEDPTWDAALADVVRLNGGELTDGDALTFVQNRGGQIRGHGRITVNSLNNHGTIAAEEGLLELTERLDWDGSGAGTLNEGDGVLSAIAGDILISNPMFTGPSFVGTINVLQGHRFTYETGGDDDLILFDDVTGDGDTGGDFGRLNMTGGLLVADRVDHEGRFVVESRTATIEASQIRFDELARTSIDSQLRLDTSGGVAALIEAGALFMGPGSLASTTGSRLIVADDAEVGVDLVNEGELHIGAGQFLSAIPASFEARSFEQTATGELVIEIEGTALDEFDRILADESAVLGGTVTATFEGGFIANLGDVFPIISTGGGGVSGRFSTEQLPEIPVIGADYALFTRYSPTLVELVTTFTADFNLDGEVNGDDFLVWQNGFGVMGGALHADGDANGDGNVDGGDFLEWQDQFGSTVSLPGAGGQTAIPEPASMLLTVILGLACASRSRTDGSTS